MNFTNYVNLSDNQEYKELELKLEQYKRKDFKKYEEFLPYFERRKIEIKNEMRKQMFKDMADELNISEDMVINLFEINIKRLKCYTEMMKLYIDIESDPFNFTYEEYIGDKTNRIFLSSKNLETIYDMIIVDLKMIELSKK